MRQFYHPYWIYQTKIAFFAISILWILLIANAPKIWDKAICVWPWIIHHIRNVGSGLICWYMTTEYYYHMEAHPKGLSKMFFSPTCYKMYWKIFKSPVHFTKMWQSISANGNIYKEVWILKIGVLLMTLEAFEVVTDKSHTD